MLLQPPVVDGGSLDPYADGGEENVYGFIGYTKESFIGSENPWIVQEYTFGDRVLRIRSKAGDLLSWTVNPEFELPVTDDQIASFIYTPDDPTKYDFIGNVAIWQPDTYEGVSQELHYFTMRSELLQLRRRGYVYINPASNEYTYTYSGPLNTHLEYNPFPTLTPVSDVATSGYVAGSLGKALYDSIYNKISGLTPSEGNCRLYSKFPSNSSYDGIKGGVDEWERNTSHWLQQGGEINISCNIAGWKKSGSSTVENWRTFTAISPRHVITCKHSSFWPPVGSTLIFVLMDNTVITRTVTAIHQMLTDAVIGYLDSDLPASVVPAGFIDAADWEAKSSSGTIAAEGGRTTDVEIYPLQNVLTMYTCQQEYGCVNQLHYTYESGNKIAVNWPQNNEWYYWGVRVGDSGSPTLAFIEGRPVLITTFTSAGGGPNYSNLLTEIQAGMDSLSGYNEHNLIIEDVSSYPNY